MVPHPWLLFKPKNYAMSLKSCKIWWTTVLLICVIGECVTETTTQITPVKNLKRTLDDITLTVVPSLNQTLWEGDAITLRCSTKIRQSENPPQSFLRWTLNSLTVTETTNLIISNYETAENDTLELTSILNISTATEADNGKYCCNLKHQKNRKNCTTMTIKILTMSMPNPAIAQACNASTQCEGRVMGSFCDTTEYAPNHNGICKCKAHYSEMDGACLRTEDVGSKKNQDIYKAAMVALACFMITLISLFVVFLCNKSVLRRLRSNRSFDQVDQRSDDIFNVAEGLAAMRPVDKPPTYEQVVTQDRLVRGVPPPSYNDSSVTANEAVAALSIQRLNTRLVQESTPVRIVDCGLRRLERRNPTEWPNENDIGSNASAVLELTTPRSRSREVLERHEDRGHIVWTNNNPPTALGVGTVNPAFVSDA